MWFCSSFHERGSIINTFEVLVPYGRNVKRQSRITEITQCCSEKEDEKKNLRKKESSLYPNGFKHVQTADNCQRKKEKKRKKDTKAKTNSLKSFKL